MRRREPLPFRAAPGLPGVGMAGAVTGTSTGVVAGKGGLSAPSGATLIAGTVQDGEPSVSAPEEAKRAPSWRAAVSNVDSLMTCATVDYDSRGRKVNRFRSRHKKT